MSHDDRDVCTGGAGATDLDQPGEVVEARDLERRRIISYLRHEATGAGPQKAHWLRELANRLERGEHDR